MTGPSRKAAALVLAAGEGTRLRSAAPPALFPLLGKPLVSYAIGACRKAGAEPVLVEAGSAAGRLLVRLGPVAEWADTLQQAAAGKLEGFHGDLLVVQGCTPFLTAGILKTLIRHHRKTGAAVTWLAASGRRVQHGQKEKSAGGSTFLPCVFRSEKLLPFFSETEKASGPAEWLQILAGRNEKVEMLPAGDPAVLMVVDNMKSLSEARARLQARVIDRLFEKGVTILDPASVVIEPDVRIGADTVVHPFSVLTGKTVIGAGCVIGPYVRMEDTRIGDGCRVEFAVLERRKIDPGKIVGPFAFMTAENGNPWKTDGTDAGKRHEKES